MHFLPIPLNYNIANVKASIKWTLVVAYKFNYIQLLYLLYYNYNS